MTRRRCRRGAFVDRIEYNETETLECPLPNCNFSWCKNCQQEVEADSDPVHSCDGTSELRHLIQTRGWRLCPGKVLRQVDLRIVILISTFQGCQTPTEKNGGCNHMTVCHDCFLIIFTIYDRNFNIQCIAPGCNAWVFIIKFIKI